MIEQRNKLLTRARRGANKKKGGTKEKSKSKNKQKGNKPSSVIGRITASKPSKKKKKPNNKPGKGGNNAGNGGNGGGNKKQPIVEEFKSCTATMITNKCLLTTAACTGSDKNANLFAKVGERVYGSNVSSI